MDTGSTRRTSVASRQGAHRAPSKSTPPRRAARALTAALGLAGLGVAGIGVGGIAAAAASTSAATLSIVAGTGTPGTPAAGPATSSPLGRMQAVAVGPHGSLYIADPANQVIEKVSSAGTLSIVAGTGAYGAPKAGPATSSPLDSPSGVAVDPTTGDLYIADTNENEVLQVTSAGTLSIFAGTGTYGAPTAGAATSSDLASPGGLAVGPNGSLYIADTGNDVIEKVSSGVLSIVAGVSGTSGAPTPGAATHSDLEVPQGIAVGPHGSLYIADANNNQVLKVSAGTLSIVAGTGTAGTPTAGPATSSDLGGIADVAVNTTTGDLYLADSDHGDIEQLKFLIPQTITLTTSPPNSATVGGTDTLAATGGASGNAVTFSIDASSTAGACSLSGAVVSFGGAGTCVIDANQAGSTTYAAAPQVQVSVSVQAPGTPSTHTPPPVTPVSPPTTVPVVAPTPAPIPAPTVAPKPAPAPDLVPTSTTARWAPPRTLAKAHGAVRLPPVPVLVTCEHTTCVGQAKITVARRLARGWRHLVLAQSRIDLHAGTRERVDLRLTSLGTRILPRLFAYYTGRVGRYRVTLTTVLRGARPHNAPTFLTR